VALGHALVAAYTVAWNAGDLEAVLALFAEDAVVRQRGAEIELSGPHVVVRDAFGVPLQYVGDPPPGDSSAVVWAAGRPQIRTWARRLLEAGHRIEAENLRAAGDAVSWDYRATTDLSRNVAGLGPTGGTAELTLRASEIATLTIESDPAGVRARETATTRALAAARTRGSPAIADAERAQGSAAGPGGRGTSAGPWVVAAALSLLGVLVLAAGTARPRRPRDEP
jgi:hypothetical protein